MNGTFAPGERLIISHLADQFSVSEIPVREALQRLSLEGYVQLVPHVGAIVSILSEEEIREIFELRIYMEALATQLAVDHLTNFHLENLEKMIESSKEMLTSTDCQFEEYAKHNRKFHEYIYRHCNNSRLYKIIFELWDYSNRYPKIFHTTETLQKSIEEHTEILNALKERDAELAAERTKNHKHKAYKILLDMLKEL
ncbi:GntR family transcriptional regulator [Sporosarcina sp. ACRSM]|nr:GntR family transcriptional regulator [Sporosarcina sp. ACRSM]